MNCSWFEEKIAQYAEGELDRVEARGVEEHLRSCAECAEFADGLEGDRAALRTPPLEVSDVDFVAMRGRIREAIARERRVAPALLIAAAILLALGMAAVWQVSHRMSPHGSYQARVPHVEQAQAPAAPTLSSKWVASPVRGRRPRRPACLESGLDCAANGGTRGSRADQGVHPPTPAAPQADLALEAALREFVAAEETPPVSTSPAAPNGIRMATSDPNVVLILLQQTSGDSNE